MELKKSITNKEDYDFMITKIPPFAAESQLQALCEQYGAIEKIDYVYGRSGPQVTYIKYKDQNNAKVAIKKLDGCQFLGQNIRVYEFKSASNKISDDRNSRFQDLRVARCGFRGRGGNIRGMSRGRGMPMCIQDGSIRQTYSRRSRSRSRDRIDTKNTRMAYRHLQKTINIINSESDSDSSDESDISRSRSRSGPRGYRFQQKNVKAVEQGGNWMIETRFLRDVRNIRYNYPNKYKMGEILYGYVTNLVQKDSDIIRVTDQLIENILKDFNPYTSKIFASYASFKEEVTLIQNPFKKSNIDSSWGVSINPFGGGNNHNNNGWK